MSKKIRRQLTFFVGKNDAQEIEFIRKKFNPEQYHLINSHVTLCREDEIENLPVVLNNLQQLNTTKISICFGKPTRFADGKGVLLPASGDNRAFHELRLKILAGLNFEVRQHEPHITLMHPRNSTCTDDIFKAIQKISLPAYLSFDSVSLIEQIENSPWKILDTFHLKKI